MVLPFFDVCVQENELLLQKLNQHYKRDEQVEKGIAFPTCISVNNWVCNFSPVSRDAAIVLDDGDVVKM